MANMTILQKIIIANLESKDGKVSIARIENLSNAIAKEFKKCKHFILKDFCISLSSIDKEIEDKDLSPKNSWLVNFAFQYNNTPGEYCKVCILGFENDVTSIREIGFLSCYDFKNLVIWKASFHLFKNEDGDYNYNCYGDDGTPDRIDYTKIPNLTKKWSKWKYTKCNKRLKYINILNCTNNHHILQDLNVTKAQYVCKLRADKWYEKIEREIEREVDTDTEKAISVLNKIYDSIINMTPLNNNILELFKNKSNMISFILTFVNDKYNQDLIKYIEDRYHINDIHSRHCLNKHNNPIDFFKDERSMYIFILIWVNNKTKNKLLCLTGIDKSSIKKLQKSIEKIAEIIKEKEDENTELALAYLNKRYKIIRNTVYEKLKKEKEEDDEEWWNIL